MSEKETTPMNSESYTVRMKDGEEPTEVLLGLVSSPLITLKQRALTTILTAKGEGGRPVVLAIFPNAVWDDHNGILLADELPTVPTETANNSEMAVILLADELPTVPTETANNSEMEVSKT